MAAMKVYTNGQWELVRGAEVSSIPVQAAAPANPADGDLWVDSDDSNLYRYNAATTTWILVGASSQENPATTIVAVEETTTARTLQLTDAGKVVEATNEAATTITVPSEASVAWLDGTVLNIYAAGAGGVTVAPGTGVVIRNNNNVAQHTEVSLRYRGADEWVQT